MKMSLAKVRTETSLFRRNEICLSRPRRIIRVVCQPGIYWLLNKAVFSNRGRLVWTKYVFSALASKLNTGLICFSPAGYGSDGKSYLFLVQDVAPRQSSM